MSIKGYVMDIQPFSVNDGDGIRTTVFLAGCPLACQWCSNPEGYSAAERIGWYQRKCIGCGHCASVCPEGIGVDLNKNREKCKACGNCVSVCPSGARSYMVKQISADEVTDQIKKHRLFYMQSGGGVTFSGGEATSQPAFLRCLAENIYDLGYDMALESCGFFDTDTDASGDLMWALEHMDMIFMDLKMIDDARHKKYTGVSNRKILENIEKAGDLPGRKVIRIPVITGVNDDEDNIRRSAAFVHDKLPDADMELLPYHEFGKIKYEALGIAYDHPGFSRPSKERMEELKRIVSAEGVSLADFR